MPKIDILYEDNDIIVVVKPSGMASQEERGAGMDMVSGLKNYLVREKKISGIPEIYVVHRLDKPVGGIMVYAKNKKAAGSLSGQIQSKSAVKEYLAVLTGELPMTEGTLTDHLLRDGKTNTSKVVPAGTTDAKEAGLIYRVLDRKEKDGQILTLVRIRLLTGRHHQIRVQMANAGAGLWGDTKYNPEFTGKRGWFIPALFSDHLEFDHPTTKKHLVFETKPGKQILDHFEIG